MTFYFLLLDLLKLPQSSQSSHSHLTVHGSRDKKIKDTPKEKHQQKAAKGNNNHSNNQRAFLFQSNNSGYPKNNMKAGPIVNDSPNKTVLNFVPIIHLVMSSNNTTTQNDAASSSSVVLKNHDRPRGCDTFVAFPPATPPGVVVFGKNSDRPAGESQSIRRYPRRTTKNSSPQEKQEELLECTYICIPQVPTTNAVLLSQIDWMWGAEMGANEQGVVIGNEAVWTREPCRGEPKALLGMDLVRLGLERGNTAREALDVITTLLEEHGQGGPCAQDDPDFTYHNSYLIVDKQEAWVLETAGRHWVAERVTSGVRNISNCLSIRKNYDLSSEGIMEHARQKKYWKPAKEGESLDFTMAFCTGSAAEEVEDPRFCGGKTLLEQHASKETGVDKDSMIAILRDHSNGICMHGRFETTSSWVSELYLDNDKAARHWVTGKPHPCNNPFAEEILVAADSSEKAHA